MLSQGAAMRIAEAAAGWLRRRDPTAWLALAIIVIKDDGTHHVAPRSDAIAMFEKARSKAAGSGRTELERDLARAIDLIKAAAPIEVPVTIFFERPDGVVETGVLTLRLPPERISKGDKSA